MKNIDPVFNKSQLAKIKLIESEIQEARNKNETSVVSKVVIPWKENFEIRSYFEAQGIYVHPCIDSTLEGHYILDWSGNYKIYL